MHKLDVKNFSCIKSASIDLSRLTILIGPQASGKSLLSKLIYFFNAIALEHRGSDETENSFEDFKRSIKEKFLEWFPPSAWSANQFKIEYCLGRYEIRISRTKYADALAENVRIWISKDVEKFHLAAQSLRKKYISKSSEEGIADDDYWDLRFQIQSEVRSLFDRTLGEDVITSQIFIPAGRSFFTSAGKAITAFEHAKMFDPITLEFGKRLANYRDRGGTNRSTNTKLKGRYSPLNQADEILGGKIIIERNGEFLSTLDGRKIPFGLLSSGQQELIPLLLILDSLFSARIPGKRFVFIEEPEAHLFPSAQSRVVELLASFTNQHPLNTILVTTHSPYVLSKVNNLILAGQYGTVDLGLYAHQTEKIAKSDYWLPTPMVSAYALEAGEAKNIMDENGLIAADYLDNISGEISREFNKLLEIGA